MVPAARVIGKRGANIKEIREKSRDLARGILGVIEALGPRGFKIEGLRASVYLSLEDSMELLWIPHPKRPRDQQQQAQAICLKPRDSSDTQHHLGMLEKGEGSSEVGRWSRSYRRLGPWITSSSAWNKAYICFWGPRVQGFGLE